MIMTKNHVFAMLAIACVAVLCSCTQKKGETITLQVKTQYGVLEGFEEDGVKKFLGVPFAQAPVGELRWKAPQPVQAWEGVREAKQFGDDPMQLDVFGDMAFRGSGRSEDCLYLNIWTTAATTADALPVLIYFNGGGLMAGSGSEPRYDGSSIAKEGVIGVTANYREGVFGFFAHPDLTAASDYKGSGNYGFLDQVAAIKWVKENIAAFGGDPDKITIVGESAGSFSVSLLMCSPLSKNLIAGAMLSSGAEVLPYQPSSQADADAAGTELLKQAGIASLADAMALNADSLQKLLPPRGMANVVLDGYFMTESADAVFEKNEQAQVPLLAGWNSLEAHPMQAIQGQAPTLENYKNALKVQFGDMTDEIFKAYGIETDGEAINVGEFLGNFAVIVRAYTYILSLGKENLRMVGPLATLNANYIKESLKDLYLLPISGLCKHEFVFDGLKDKSTGVTTMDVAKRLLDYGYHAPTIYFPLLFHESLMIEPTESESLDTIDGFISVMRRIAEEAATDPELVKSAPHNTPIGRVDDVLAAKHPVLTYRQLKSEN